MKRFTRTLLVACVAAGVFVTAAAALRFTDESYFTPEGVVEQSYSHQFNGDGGCGPTLPYQYKVINGALPPGLSLSSSGLVSGKPTQAGLFSFWVELSDEDPPSQSWCLPKTAQREFTINVIPRLLVTDQVPGAGTVGAAYSLGLVAVVKSGPEATSPPSSPVTWSVQSGQLPPGLALGADGVLSGTPTTEGSYSFIVLAVLDPKRSDTKGHTIVVRTPVAITAPPSSRPEVGVPFRLPLSAGGGTGTYTWSLSSGALPPGVALGADGTISGTPRTAGTFRFTATATDAESRTANYPATLNVASRLAIATRLLRLAKVGHLYRMKLRASGGVLPKTWKVTNGPLPRGIHLDRKLGVLSGTPTRPGTYRMTFEVRDGLQVASTKTLKLVVIA
ncbi:MAG: hypothetical protein A2Y55_01550 [Actinobacteria bacterium RBG_16_68_12]|nr:MAG: hypothetical protein A2Y55_01550 [Actinobacteria bacterium RBG_16_68_12]